MKNMLIANDSDIFTKINVQTFLAHTTDSTGCFVDLEVFKGSNNNWSSNLRHFGY